MAIAARVVTDALVVTAIAALDVTTVPPFDTSIALMTRRCAV
jgi:hypothetical protein